MDRSHDNIYTAKQITSWITYICDGLSYLNVNDIVHRDIKPENTLLGNSYDDVRISDFGITGALKDVTAGVIKQVGTLIYTAPEILNGDIFDISIDVYSVSITIWKMLHRRVPFDHITSEQDKLDIQIINRGTQIG